MTRQSCPSCGTDQELSPSPGNAPRCMLCGTPMAAGATPTVRPVSPRSPVTLRAGAMDVHSVDAVDEEDARTHLARLSEERFDPSAEVARLLAFEKRATSALALVPVWGPVRIWRSDVHGLAEKVLWSVLSLALSVGLALGTWAVLPGSTDPGVALGARIDSDLAALSELAGRYRERFGSYPDPATWKSSADRGDSRFYDPWGRIYLFREEAGRVSLGTLGRDGVPGGSGPDADRFVAFGP